MKRKIALFALTSLIFMTMISTSACGKAALREMSRSGTIGNFYVDIKDYRITTRDFGDDWIILITFDFTNNDSRERNFTSIFSTAVYQDGIRLDGVILTHGIENFDHRDASRNIRPGRTLELERAYILRNLRSPVEVVISRSGRTISRTFEIR